MSRKARQLQQRRMVKKLLIVWGKFGARMDTGGSFARWGRTGVCMYEPWHFRYVGKEAALFLWENNLTLEEFWEILESE